MSEKFYITRVGRNLTTCEPCFSYLTKSGGWCKSLAEAMPFKNEEQASLRLNDRVGDILTESQIKASPNYVEMKKTSPKPPIETPAKNAKSAFLTKKAPAWHAEVAAELIKDFAQVNELSEKARHRRLRLGFMFLFVKEMGKSDKSIPHGQFQPWLTANCPGIPLRTAGDYLAESNSVCDLVGWQAADVVKLSPHKLIGTPSDADRKKHDKFFEIISQKGDIRAVTQYKQVEIDAEDATVSKAGRLPGHGGASKEQRANAAERELQERITAKKLKALEIAEWLVEMSDDKGLGEISGSDEAEQLDSAMETARGYMKHHGGVQ